LIASAAALTRVPAAHLPFSMRFDAAIIVIDRRFALMRAPSSRHCCAQDTPSMPVIAALKPMLCRLFCPSLIYHTAVFIFFTGFSMNPARRDARP